MINHRSKFSSTEYNYAIDLSSFAVHNRYATMSALWFKKQKRWTIHEGIISVYGIGSEDPLKDFLDNHDGKYNGATKFKWDGISMWSDDMHNRFMPMMDAYNRLNPILEEFIHTFEESKKPDALLKNSPSVPKGYSGWFCVKAKR